MSEDDSVKEIKPGRFVASGKRDAHIGRTREEAKRLLDQATTENDWRRTVIEYAELRGWRVYHVADVRGRLRSGTSVGFPDLVLARSIHRVVGRIVYAELKTERGTLTEDQVAWARILKAASAEVYLWRPSDWPEVEDLLS